MATIDTPYANVIYNSQKGTVDKRRTQPDFSHCLKYFCWNERLLKSCFYTIFLVFLRRSFQAKNEVYKSMNKIK